MRMPMAAAMRQTELEKELEQQPSGTESFGADGKQHSRPSAKPPWCLLRELGESV